MDVKELIKIIKEKGFLDDSFLDTIFLEISENRLSWDDAENRIHNEIIRLLENIIEKEM